MNEIIPGYNVKLPTDWELKTIGQISTRVGSGVTPRGGSEVYTNEGAIFIRSQNVTFAGLNLSDTVYIDDKTHRFMSSSEVFPFDVLLNITGASIGRCCFVPDDIGRANQNQHVCTVRLPEPNWADAKYLSSVLSSPIGQSQIARLNAGGNREGLNYSQLRSFMIVWPTSPERSRIAEILSTLDRAIEQTEALISKHQRIKSGLLQDLLTRGIDDHGKLRSEITHKFKDSPLGRIPAEWDCQTLDRLLLRKQYGISTSLSEEPSGVPVLRMNNLVSGEVDYSDLKYSKEAATLKLLLNNGDVLFNRTNSIDYVGRTGIFRHTGFDVSFASYLVRLIPDPTALLPEYLNLWLNDASNQICVKRFATIGVQQANVNPTNLGTLEVAYPSSIEEQQQIIAAVSTSSHALSDTRLQLNKLRSLKTGLMQDLLTGRRRVTSLLSEPLEAVA